MSPATLHDYQQLPTSHDDDAGSEESWTSTKKPSGSRLSLWPLILCVICTAINLISILAFRAQPSTSTSSYIPAHFTHDDIAKLRRPSQFIGMNQVHFEKYPTNRDLDNWAIMISQIDSANPGQVGNSDPLHRNTSIGVISPVPRRIYLNDTVSTIIQFRVLDWGMERCSVNLLLPHEPEGHDGFKIAKRSFKAALYRLDAPLPLNEDRLSYRTRPARRTKIAERELGAGTNWTQTVTCVTDEVLTFELACAENQGSRCAMDWWQDHETVAPILYLKQQSSF